MGPPPWKICWPTLLLSAVAACGGVGGGGGYGELYDQPAVRLGIQRRRMCCLLCLFLFHYGTPIATVCVRVCMSNLYARHVTCPLCGQVLP